MKTTLKNHPKMGATPRRLKPRPRVAQLVEDFEMAQGKIAALQQEVVKLRKLAGLDTEDFRRWAWERDYVELIDSYLNSQQEALRNSAAKFKDEVRGRRKVGLEAALVEWEKAHPELKAKR